LGTPNYTNALKTFKIVGSTLDQKLRAHVVGQLTSMTSKNIADCGANPASLEHQHGLRTTPKDA